MKKPVKATSESKLVEGKPKLQLSLSLSKQVFSDFESIGINELEGAGSQEITDCMWKLQAVHHHYCNACALEEHQLEIMKEYGSNIKGNWIVIAREPWILLRFEFEALLHQVYSCLNIASIGIVRILGEKVRTPSFRKLSKTLDGLKTSNPYAKQILDLYEKTKIGALADFHAITSSRDKITHFNSLRCRPVQIKSEKDIDFTVTYISDTTVGIKSGIPNQKFTILCRWSDDLTKEFIVYPADSSCWPGYSGKRNIFSIPASDKSVDNVNLSERAKQLFEATRYFVVNAFKSALGSSEDRGYN